MSITTIYDIFFHINTIYCYFLLTPKSKGFMIPHNFLHTIDTAGGFTMLKKKVLIVDDERNLSKLIMELLIMLGDYNVERAFDGREALEKYKSFLPDIFLWMWKCPLWMVMSHPPRLSLLILTPGS